jgi:hypothetical protein
MVRNVTPEFKFALNMCSKYGVKSEHAMPLYLEFQDYFRPVVLRTAQDALQGAWAQLQAHIDGMEDGAETNLPELMKTVGLDPALRSDAQRTRSFLKESGVLQYHPGSPERWVKRLDGPASSNGQAAANGADD